MKRKRKRKRKQGAGTQELPPADSPISHFPSHVCRGFDFASQNGFTGWTWTQLYTVRYQWRIQDFSGGVNPRFRAPTHYLGKNFRKTNWNREGRGCVPSAFPWIRQYLQTLLFQNIAHETYLMQQKSHVQIKFETILSWNIYVKISPV